MGRTNGGREWYHAPFGRKKERNGGPPRRRGPGGRRAAGAGRTDGV